MLRKVRAQARTGIGLIRGGTSLCTLTSVRHEHRSHPGMPVEVHDPLLGGVRPDLAEVRCPSDARTRCRRGACGPPYRSLRRCDSCSPRAGKTERRKACTASSIDIQAPSLDSCITSSLLVPKTRDGETLAPCRRPAERIRWFCMSMATLIWILRHPSTLQRQPPPALALASSVPFSACSRHPYLLQAPGSHRRRCFQGEPSFPA